MTEAQGKRRWIALLFICLAIWIQQLDATIINLALPRIGRSLHGGNADMQWIIDSFNLVVAGFVLLGSGLADRFGRRRIFTVGMSLFFIGSIGGATAGSIPAVIGARIVMGLGTAFTVPASLALITVIFAPGRERKTAIGVWAAVAGLGIALGPVLGGLLLSSFSWPAVFWVNVPAALIAAIGLRIFADESRKQDSKHLDVVGAVLSVVALGSIVFGLIEGPGLGWTSPIILACIGIGAVGLVTFVWWERHQKSPMFDVDVLRNPMVAVLGIAIGLTYFTTFALFFLIPEILRYGHGFAESVVGIAMLPLGLVLAVMSQVALRLSERVGLRPVIIFGLITATIGLVGLALGPRSPYAVILIAMIVFSVGWASITATSTAAIMDALPLSKAGDASAVNQLSRQVGGVLGVAVIGTIVSVVYRVNLQLPASLSAADQYSASRSVSEAVGVARTLPADLEVSVVARANDAFATATTTGLLVAAFLSAATAVAAYLVVKPSVH